MESIAPEGKFVELDEFRATRERRQALAEGIPASMLSDSVSTPPSGISRVIERSEIIDLRESELPSLRQFEQDLARLVAIVSNVDVGTAIDLDSVAVSVDYAEERVYVEPDVEYAADRVKMSDGVLDPREFYRKWSGFDTAISEDDLLATLRERAQLLARIEAARSEARAEVTTPIAEPPENVNNSATNNDETEPDSE